MYLLFIFLLNNIFCGQTIMYESNTLQRNLKNSYALNTNDYLPNFYSYNEFSDLGYLRLYYEKIIIKIRNCNIFKLCRKNLKLNKDLFITDIKKIHDDIKQRNAQLITLESTMNYYQKLEHDLLSFYYSKILRIVDMNDNKNIEIAILKQDILIINELCVSINKMCLKLQKNIKNNDNKSIKVFDCFSQVLDILKNEKLDIKETINNLEIKINYFIAKFFDEYDKLMMPYQNSLTPKLDNLKSDKLLNIKNIKNVIFVIEKCFYDEIKKDINLNSEEIDVFILAKIGRIHKITRDLFSLPDYKSKEKIFLNTFMYYNYLKKKVSVKRFLIEKNTQKNNNKFLISYSDKSIQRCLKIEKILNLLESLFIKVINDFINYEKLIDGSYTKNLPLQSLDYFYDFKIMISKEDIRLQYFLMTFVILDNITDTSRFSIYHCLYKQINVLNDFQNLLKDKWNGSLDFEHFLDFPDFFKMVAKIETRLAIIYFYLQIEYDEINFTSHFNLLKQRIQELQQCLDRNPTVYSEYKNKIFKRKKTKAKISKKEKMNKFIKLLIRQYEEPLKTCKKIEARGNFFEYNNNLKDLYLEELKIEIEMYQIENNMI
ncbi:hypothetical protein NUSPORA_00487 [Nucleospora cyclopteri]